MQTTSLSREHDLEEGLVGKLRSKEGKWIRNHQST
jgi:hypothetical protein